MLLTLKSNRLRSTFLNLSFFYNFKTDARRTFCIGFYLFSIFFFSMTQLSPLSSSLAKLLFVLCLLSISSYACKTEEQGNASINEEAEALLDSLDMSPALVDDEPDCSPDDTYLICNRGLSFAPLGMSIADMHAEELEELGLSENDSLDYEMEYVRLNRSFSFEGGFILLEGEAILENDATDELLSASTLSRIRIESPLFHTLDGISPGASLEELQGYYADEEIFISSFGSIKAFADNPKYEFMMLNPEAHPNITYLLPDPGHRLYESNKDQETILLSSLPKTQKISSIVVSQ